MNSESAKNINIEQNTETNPSGDYSFDNCICKVLIIDTDYHFMSVLANSLEYFSFNGKKLNILESSSISDAEKIINNTDNIILIIFNKMVFGINGQSGFMNLLRKYIDKKNGKVIFRYNGASPKPFIEMTSSSYKINRHSEFEYARDRLIDLVQMAIVTYSNDKFKAKYDKNENSTNIFNSDNSDNTLSKQTEVKSDKSFFSVADDDLYEMLAHGLKGPIGNIKVLMEALTSDPDLFDEEISHKLLSNVSTSADSMNEMIDSFLFWSRLRKNELNFNPIRINVKNLILENINLLKGTATEKDIELQFDISNDVIAFADEVMITTVIRNLIYNAIKFTNRGGQVRAIVRAEGELIKITIKDTGVGISADNIKKIFNPEARISTKGTENETGLGMGLLLCKDYAEKNGGKLSVESEVGKGSKFTLSIPRWKSLSRN